MAQLLKLSMVLARHFEGQTLQIGRHWFQDGKCELIGQPEHIGHAVRFLSYYAAYPEGSSELKEAQEASNGKRNSSKSIESGASEKISSNVRQVGEESSEEGSDNGEAATNPEEGSEKLHPAGNGHEYAGVPVESENENGSEPIPPLQVDQKLVEALMALDPSIDEYWTSSGLPRISAIEEAMGSTGITRKIINEALLGWNREKSSGFVSPENSED